MLRMSSRRAVLVVSTVGIIGWLAPPGDGAHVSGVVRDAAGVPVEGARVSVLPGNMTQAISGTDGRYELDWDSTRLGGQDVTFCLVARHSQRNLAAVVEMGPETERVDVRLEPGLSFSGKVVDPNGRGIAKAHLRAVLRVSYWDAPVSPELVLTAADGTFTWAGFPRNQTYEIQAAADGYGRVLSDVKVAQTQGDTVDLGAIVLPVANLSITGRVVGADRRPMAGVNLHANAEGQPERLSARTDDEGRFTLHPVCPGPITLYADVRGDGRSLSGRLATEGGATGVRMVVYEGRSQLQYHSIRSYEQIVGESPSVIAGAVVDESGTPVPDVIVSVRCHKTVSEDGRPTWAYSSWPMLRAVTDEQGRFAIAFEEDGEYSLLFSPDRHAATIVYDIALNTKDVKVTLDKGGTIEGRLLRLEGTQEVPIPNAEVKLVQNSRLSYTHLGFDRDQTTRTDDDGRFRFERIQMRVRPNGSRRETEWTPVPRVWQIHYGDTVETFAFTDGTMIEDFEVLVKPSVDAAGPLVGKPLPALGGIAIDLSANPINGRCVLVCFFDYQQRPSRNTVLRLAGQAKLLAEQNITVLGVQAAEVDRATLDAWAHENEVAFPVGTITADIEAIRALWHVESLPWLILADKDHTVSAEGFSVSDLEAQIEEMSDVVP